MNESELLFTEILGCDRASLYLKKNVPVAKTTLCRIASALKRRMRGEPVSYILGKTEFMGFEFKVGPAVLIPRPETELVVETALRHAAKLPGRPGAVVKILDVGTGSGCIAVSLAKNLAHCRIDAIDISEVALAVAIENAALHNAEINFIQGDLLSCELPPTAYDLIISNPPYVLSAEIKNLQPEVQHEPRAALDGGTDGLGFYRAIIARAPCTLRDGGFLIMEMGFKQCVAITQIVQGAGNFIIQEVKKDYNGIERVMVAQYNTR